MYKFNKLREEVSNEILDLILIRFLERIKKYDNQMYPIYLMLYDHGFRIKEVLEADRWILSNNGIFTIKTEKKSMPRNLEFEKVDKKYRDELDWSGYKGSLRNYTQIKRRFETYFGANFFTENNRKLITHLFRHNFVKKKYNEGLSIEEISKIIGEVNEANTRGYVESKIYKESWQKLQF